MAFYETTTKLDDVKAYFAARPGSIEALPESTEYIDARCYVCQCDTRFTVRKLPTDECINWCETVVCPGCGLMNRSAHLCSEKKVDAKTRHSSLLQRKAS